MDNHRGPSMRSIFKDIGHRKAPKLVNSSSKNPTFERLSQPKPKDKRWIPDRPSVYWLDYIIDPTPHKLTDPEELSSYYDNFESRFPRSRLLSAPRSYYGSLSQEEVDALSRPLSQNTGIPISALTYKASERIKELARPKTSCSGTNNNFMAEPSSTRLTPPTISRQSLQTARRHSPKGKVRYFDPSVDLARGDFPSRSKHAIHTHSSKERTIPTSATAVSSSNFLKSRSQSGSSYHTTGRTVTRDVFRNDKRRPASQTLYSVRN